MQFKQQKQIQMVSSNYFLFINKDEVDNRSNSKNTQRM